MLKRLKKLKFSQVVLILLVVLILVLWINSHFRTEQSRIEDIVNEFTFEDSNEDELVTEGTINPPQVSQRITDNVPYYSNQFNVSYNYAEQTFQVYINPATETTQADVYIWFSQFEDYNEQVKNSIVFVEDRPGAPVF